jgi:hypothetical protein
VQRGLGSTVHGHVGHRCKGQPRRDIDDHSLLLAAQQRQDLADKLHRRSEVDRNLLLQIVQRMIAGEAAAILNTGIVENDAEVRVLGGNPVDQRPSAFRVGHVADSRDKRRLDRLRVRQRLGSAAADDDAVSPLKKLLRERKSDTAGAPGHKDGAVAQCHRLGL